MSMDDLFKSLQMFQNGVQQYAINGAVNDATNQMNQINQAQIKDQEKRVAQQQLANQLALRLTGAGADAARVQQAFNAVNPQNFGSVEQMQLEGQLSGNKGLLDASSKILGERRQQQLEQMRQDFNMRAALQDRQFNQQLMLEQMKLAKTKPELKPEELAFQSNVQVAGKLINDLEKTVKDYGTWESGVPVISDAKASAKLDSIPYQLAITYAKIVDPNSVAREGEVAAAQKYMLNLGMFSNKEKTLAAIKNMKDTISQYQGARTNVQEGAGVRSFAPQQQQAAPNVQVRYIKGQPVKVMQLPDGSFQEVP